MNAGAVYLFFTKPFHGRVFVKVGMSSMVYERVATLLTGCPLEMDVVLFTIPIDQKRAYQIESKIHGRLKHRQSAREWFVLDQTEDCLKEFNEAVFESFKEVYGEERRLLSTCRNWINWREMTADDYADWVSEKNKQAPKRKKAFELTGKQQIRRRLHRERIGCTKA